MKKLKTTFHKVEKILLTLGTVIAFIFIFLIPIIGKYEYEGLIGYFLGLLAFKVSTKVYFLLEKKSKAILIFLNLKLVIFSGLIYILHMAGISAIHTIVGALINQVLAYVTLTVTLHKAFNY